MGMSADIEAAIAEGATIVRVGTSGVFAPDMELRSIVLADNCVTNSAIPGLLLGRVIYSAGMAAAARGAGAPTRKRRSAREIRAAAEMRIAPSHIQGTPGL